MQSTAVPDSAVLNKIGEQWKQDKAAAAAQMPLSNESIGHLDEYTGLLLLKSLAHDQEDLFTRLLHLSSNSKSTFHPDRDLKPSTSVALLAPPPGWCRTPGCMRDQHQVILCGKCQSLRKLVVKIGPTELDVEDPPAMGTVLVKRAYSIAPELQSQGLLGCFNCEYPSYEGTGACVTCLAYCTFCRTSWFKPLSREAATICRLGGGLKSDVTGSDITVTGARATLLLSTSIQHLAVAFEAL